MRSKSTALRKFGSDMAEYSIDEASQRTGVTAHTLRYYEREGLLDPIGRATNGHRRYTDDDLGWVTFLTLLRATGMPIREMHTFIAITKAGDHTIPERLTILKRHRDALEAKMAADREHLQRLNHKISIYSDLLDQAPVPELVAG